MKARTAILTTIVCAHVFLVQSANATFHFMQIQQVIGGVDGDTSAQAVQLRMLSVGQNLLNGQARLVAYDATGSNPVVITTFPPPNPASGSCREILIASDGFAAVTTPSADSAARDYGMASLIPASYLPAGSLTFETSTGSIVYWRISWGGGAYSGATTGSITNDGDGQFGPPFGGALPSTSTDALEYVGNCPPGTSSSNNVDYAVASGGSDFTNNAGSTFSVTGVPEEVPAVTGWGLFITALCILTAATIVLSRRGAPAGFRHGSAALRGRSAALRG